MSRKYEINESIFESIDNEEKAYILGFLYADGYINIKNNHVELTLKKSDLQILESIKNIIFNKERPLIPIKNGKYLRLSISSRRIVNDLYKLGCIQKKTFLLKFPKIKKSLIRHFIRGYFDGDGSVYIQKNVLNISILGTIDLLNKMQEIFITKLNFNKTELDERHPERKTNIRSLRYGGNVIMNRFYHYIYDDSKIFLKRKRSKFESILSGKDYFRNKSHSRNLSNKKSFTYDDKVWTNISELCRYISVKTKIKFTTIKSRIKNGWSLEEILKIKLNSQRPRIKKRILKIDMLGNVNEYDSIQIAAKKNNVAIGSIYHTICGKRNYLNKCKWKYEN